MSARPSGAALTSLIFAMLLALGAPASQAQAPSLKAGDKLPRVAALTLEGEALTSDMLMKRAGTRAVLVQFWAAWCAPCKEELAQLSRGHAKLKEAGVEVLLVNLMDSEAEIAAVMDAIPGLKELELVRDTSGAIIRAYHLGGDGQSREIALPYAVLADANSKVLTVFQGAERKYVKAILRAVP